MGTGTKFWSLGGAPADNTLTSARASLFSIRNEGIFCLDWAVHELEVSYLGPECRKIRIRRVCSRSIKRDDVILGVVNEKSDSKRKINSSSLRHPNWNLIIKLNVRVSKSNEALESQKLRKKLINVSWELFLFNLSLDFVDLQGVSMAFDWFFTGPAKDGLAIEIRRTKFRNNNKVSTTLRL